MGGGKDVPLVVIKMVEEVAAWPATVGEKNVPAMPLLFVVATSLVVDKDINKSAGQGSGGGGGGKRGGHEAVNNVAWWWLALFFLPK
jgi:hypothetical protein